MTNPNHPAFLQRPETVYDRNPQDCDTSYGITKREYFAAMTMSGIAMWDATINDKNETGKVEELARACVSYADAIIAELNRESK